MRFTLSNFESLSLVEANARNYTVRFSLRRFHLFRTDYVRAQTSFGIGEISVKSYHHTLSSIQLSIE